MRRERPARRSSGGRAKSDSQVERARGLQPAGQLRVPPIITQLFSAPTLYPGEDPAHFDDLLLELALMLQPTNLVEWLLVADLRAVIFDEGRYRRVLAMILSPGKLLEPEPS